MAGAAALARPRSRPAARAAAALEGAPSPYSIGDPPTALEYITSYNNFYEFGLDKGDPQRNAGELTTAPWSVAIDGLVGTAGNLRRRGPRRPEPARGADLPAALRRGLVDGDPLDRRAAGASVLAQAEPAPRAKYVAFETLVRPEEMPGQRGMFQTLDWPYVEGLRLDEAMHPLTLLAVGALRRDAAEPERRAAAAGGAVEVRLQVDQVDRADHALTEEQPPTTWNMQAPNEYGFYSNVNPTVSHPRWSQASERVIGGGLLREAPRHRDVQRLCRRGRRASTPAWTCGDSTEAAGGEPRRSHQRRAAPRPGRAALRRWVSRRRRSISGWRCRTGSGADPVKVLEHEYGLHRAAAADRGAGGDAAARTDRDQPAAVPAVPRADGLLLRR